MAIGTSLMLIAFGAILAVGVDYRAQGINIQAIGGILIAIGVFGLLMSLLFWSDVAGGWWRRPASNYPAGHYHNEPLSHTHTDPAGNTYSHSHAEEPAHSHAAPPGHPV